MESDLDKYCRIMCISSDDTLHYLRKMMSVYFYNWVFNYFDRTRNYELGLRYISLCYTIISLNATAISKEEYEQLDRDLIYGKLRMLDGLNRWQDYIATFDFARKNKDYGFVYTAASRGINSDTLDEVSGEDSYILKVSNGYVYVHFLSSVSDRYDIIKRKYKRLCSGKSVDHLKKHSQDLLTEYELKRRLSELYFKLYKIMYTYNLE